MRGGRQNQALETAPAGAQAKELERLDEARVGRLVAGLQLDGEQARSAAELGSPQLVVGIGRERGVEHAHDLGLVFQPARDLEGAGLVPFEAHAERPQPAQAEPADVGRGRGAVAHAPAASGLERFVGARGEPEHDVAVATDVLGARVDGDVDAQGVGVEEARRAPGRVAGHGRAHAAGDLDHPADVDDAHGQARGHLDEDEAGVVGGQ